MISLGGMIGQDITAPPVAFHVFVKRKTDSIGREPGGVDTLGETTGTALRYEKGIKD